MRQGRLAFNFRESPQMLNAQLSAGFHAVPGRWSEWATTCSPSIAVSHVTPYAGQQAGAEGIPPHEPGQGSMLVSGLAAV
ncbi:MULTISPECIES: hypothetical protein [Paenibacillus]|uniref:Uncharacterized protein n=1 Tax=Paenibacillus campinasensis TaxID=66347 RepID=A0ABW9T466_9BACL|nr:MULTISPECIES: hypothetical protein [Paenibacillus]MUG68110.1 hypothetical protein [Paenibacillus campinasensis]